MPMKQGRISIFSNFNLKPQVNNRQHSLQGMKAKNKWKMGLCYIQLRKWECVRTRMRFKWVCKTWSRDFSAFLEWIICSRTWQIKISYPSKRKKKALIIFFILEALEWNLWRTDLVTFRMLKITSLCMSLRTTSWRNVSDGRLREWHTKKISWTV